MNLLAILPRYRLRRRLLATLAGGSLGPLLFIYIITRLVLDRLGAEPLPRACDRALLLLAALVTAGLVLLLLLTRSLSNRESFSDNNHDRRRSLFVRLAWLQPALLLTSSLGGLACLAVVILAPPWQRLTAAGNVFLLLSIYLPAAGAGTVMAANGSIRSLLAHLEQTEVHGTRLGVRPRTVLWTLLVSTFACGTSLLLYTVAGLKLPAANGAPPGRMEIITETVAWTLFFSSLMGWFIGQEMQAAANQLRAQLQRVGSSQQLLERLPLPAGSEISGAAAAFNRLAERLEASHQRLQNFAENVRRNEKLQKRFLAGVSHELRTPLNGIIGYADLLSGGFEGRLTSEQGTAVQIIEQEGERLLRLINDILLLARLESGREQVEPRQELLADLPHKLLAPESAAPATIEWQLDDGTGQNLVAVDVTRLGRALERLAKMLARSSGPEAIRGSIATTGSGELLLELIAGEFQPPSDADQQSTWLPFSRPSGSGSAGLDLPIAAGLIKLLGGSVKFTTRSGQGVIQLSLPCQVTSDNAPNCNSNCGLSLESA